MIKNQFAVIPAKAGIQKVEWIPGKRDVDLRRWHSAGNNRNNVINFLHFIDWMMRLPDKTEEMFWEEIHWYEEEKNMLYTGVVVAGTLPELGGIPVGRQ